MNAFEQELNERLATIQAQGLRRELRRIDSPQSAHIQFQGRPLLNFSSNDYLGLANHPALKEAAIRAVERFGAGSGASRLICGSLAPHHELEEALAAFKGTPAALAFSTGYAAALGAITALLTKDDILVTDKLIHACCVDAARLSGAKLRVFKHNDPEDLERILQWADQSPLPNPESRRRRILVVTESVFSMDGDFALLREIIELKEKYGAWLMVDEAHATGLFGEHRRGLAEAYELADRVDIQLGTLGKAVGAAGGYVAGSRALVDYLINRARSFIFSTAPPPAAATAAKAGIELLGSAEGEARRQQLWARVDELKNALVGGPWPLPTVRSAIIPLVLGQEEEALRVSAALLEQGIFIPAIRYPTVARGQARLRLTVTGDHTKADLEKLIRALGHLPTSNHQEPA